MSVCPGATNSAQSEAYFYTKKEINEGVFFALSTLANFSTTTLLANLTVSSIVCNPSGSINGAGTMSTATLLANVGTVNLGNLSTLNATNMNGTTIKGISTITNNLNAVSANISTLTANTFVTPTLNTTTVNASGAVTAATLNGTNANIANAVIGINPAGGASNFQLQALGPGYIKISGSTNTFGGLQLGSNFMAFQEDNTGSTNLFAQYQYTGGPSSNGIALTNISTINGAPLSGLTNTSSFTTASISSATISTINNAIVPKYQIVTTPGLSVNVPLAVGSTINLASYFAAPFTLQSGRLYDVDIEGQWNFSGAPNAADFGYYTVRGTLSPYWLASTQPQGSSYQNQTFVYRTIVQGNGSPLTPTLNASFSNFGIAAFQLNRVVVGTIG